LTIWQEGKNYRKALVEYMNLQDASDKQIQNACLETSMYAIAGILFAMGTWMFLPIWKDDTATWDWNTVGAWLFIIGSFGFVYAGLNSALNLRYDPLFDKIRVCGYNPYYLAREAVTSGLCGSVLFVVGSFYFRPAGYYECPDEVSIRWCSSTASTGAWCFIIGSCCFVWQSFLALLGGLLTHSHKFREEVLQSIGAIKGDTATTVGVVAETTAEGADATCGDHASSQPETSHL